MRITGGTYRGRKVNPVDNPGIRPSKSMVREALFSILGPGYCRDLVVADLFSGSGIMALESLSRGSRTVYCVDSDLKSCRLIRANMERLKISSQGTIYHLRVDKALDSFAAQRLKFDLLFLDPPYRQPELGLKAIAQAARLDILAPGAVAVLEHHYKAVLQPLPGLEVYKQRRYGHTMLSFYRSETNSNPAGSSHD
jgi:16S rRNA (guanine966-N2)-methyltransferase